MFDPASRYAALPVRERTVTTADGQVRTVRYAARRVLPRLDAATVVTRHQVADGERLDVLADRYVSDPAGFWLLCDANPVIWPGELERPGTSVVVAIPGA